MTTRRSTEAQDERVLRWVRWRSAGHTAAAIARHEGVTKQRVIIATNRVLDTDLAESGEPEGIVRAGYW